MHWTWSPTFTSGFTGAAVGQELVMLPLGESHQRSNRAAIYDTPLALAQSRPTVAPSAYRICLLSIPISSIFRSR